MKMPGCGLRLFRGSEDDEVKLGILRIAITVKGCNLGLIWGRKRRIAEHRRGSTAKAQIRNDVAIGSCRIWENGQKAIVHLESKIDDRRSGRRLLQNESAWRCRRGGAR